jgi:hypothetical protein
MHTQNKKPFNFHFSSQSIQKKSNFFLSNRLRVIEREKKNKLFMLLCNLLCFIQ